MLEIAQHVFSFSSIFFLPVIEAFPLLLQVFFDKILFLLLFRDPIMDFLQLHLRMVHRIVLYLLEPLHAVRLVHDARLKLHKTVGDLGGVVRGGKGRPEALLHCRGDGAGGGKYAKGSLADALDASVETSVRICLVIGVACCAEIDVHVCGRLLFGSRAN